MQASNCVDDEEQEVSFADCLEHLSLDLYIHRDMRIIRKTAGVDEPELTGVPLRAGEMPVARSASFVADDGCVFTDDAVEECRLAHVGPADQGDYRNIHAAIASSSLARTSMKSYDG